MDNQTKPVDLEFLLRGGHRQRAEVTQTQFSALMFELSLHSDQRQGYIRVDIGVLDEAAIPYGEIVAVRYPRDQETP